MGWEGGLGLGLELSSEGGWAGRRSNGTSSLPENPTRYTYLYVSFTGIMYPRRRPTIAWVSCVMPAFGGAGFRRRCWVGWRDQPALRSAW